jgi:hypothetical protein
MHCHLLVIQAGQATAVVCNKAMMTAVMHLILQVNNFKAPHLQAPEVEASALAEGTQLTTHSFLAPLGILMPWQEVQRHFLVREE